MISYMLSKNRWVTSITPDDFSIPLLKSLTDCYIKCFNAKGSYEWNELWSEKQVSQIISEMLKNKCTRRRHFIGSFLTEEEPRGKEFQIIGFCLGLIIHGGGALHLSDMPHHVDVKKKVHAQNALQKLYPGDTKFIFIRELAIIPSKRKGVSQIAKLVSTMLELPPDRIEHTLFWTSKQTFLYFLVIGTGARPIYSFEDAKSILILKYLTKSLRKISSRKPLFISLVLKFTLRKLGLSKIQPR